MPGLILCPTAAYTSGLGSAGNHCQGCTNDVTSIVKNIRTHKYKFCYVANNNIVLRGYTVIP